MPRPPLKAERAFLRSQQPEKRRDFTPAEWRQHVEAVGRAVNSWLHYLETGEKK